MRSQPWASALVTAALLILTTGCEPARSEPPPARAEPSQTPAIATTAAPELMPAAPPQETALERTPDFRATTTDHLAAPLQQAYAAAIEEGQTRFHLVFAPGDYRDFAVSLASTRDLDLLIEGEGETPVILDGITLKLSGRDITLRNLVFRGAQAPVATLDVQVANTFLGEGLAFLDNLRHDSSSTEPLIQIAAAGAKNQPSDVTLRDLWLLGNRVEGHAALIATPRTGRTYLQSLRCERCLMAGNHSRWGLQPWFTRQVTLSHTFIAEPHITDAWLYLNSPLAAVQWTDSLLSTSAQAVHFATSPDVARIDYAPIPAHATAILLGEAVDPSAFATHDCTSGAPLALPADLGPWRALATAGQRPEITVLRP